MKRYCFAIFISTLKIYTKNVISNEELVRELFSAIYIACGTSNKNKETDWIGKDEISRIINQKSDLPISIKKSLIQCNIETLNSNLMNFYKKYLNESSIEMLEEELSNIYLNDSSIFEEQKVNLQNFKTNSFKKITYLLVNTAKICNKIIGIKRRIYKKGKNEINYIIDNIIEISFKKTKSNKDTKLIVIPFDADFNLHLSLYNDPKTIVSPKSLHGKWLLKMKENGMDEDALKRTIKPNNYKIGDVRIHKFNQNIFYLLAISKFDSKNIAHANKNDIKQSIIELLNFYNEHGLAYELYIPLLGTGNSRAKLDFIDSFKLIKDTIIENIDLLNGIINIVIYDQDYKEIEEDLNVL